MEAKEKARELAASKNRNTKIMNKTAVQQIVERFEELKRKSIINDSNELSIRDYAFELGKKIGFTIAASIAAEFLEQEKKEILEAYLQGSNSNEDKLRSDKRFGENYYQQTFKQ